MYRKQDERTSFDLLTSSSTFKRSVPTAELTGEAVVRGFRHRVLEYPYPETAERARFSLHTCARWPSARPAHCWDQR